MTYRIDIGSLSLGTGAAISGVLWNVGSDGPQGWDSPPVQSSSSSITAHHGGYLLGSQYEPRTVVVPGSFIASSEATFWAAHALLSSLVGLTTPATLTVYEPVPKSLSVVLGATPLIDPRYAPQFADFSLSLKAHDPFKRGAARTVTVAAGASAAVTYVGTWPAAPTITTTGAGTVDVSIAATGTRVQAASVPSGTVIDCHEPGHTAYTGTLNQYGKLVQPVGWLRLAVGANTIVNNGTAPVTIDYYDTYL